MSGRGMQRDFLKSPSHEKERLLAKQKREIEKSGANQSLRSPRLQLKSHVSIKNKLQEEQKAENAKLLILAFVSMMFVGTGNRIFLKLQTIPMHDYPFFLNMLTSFVYIPVCFAYILPMQMFGSSITREQRNIPRHKFAIMGFLDSISGIMCVFSVNYISNGSMIVLLQQAAIPISMAISRIFLKARYTVFQYLGAVVVIAGIVLTMLPTFFSSSDLPNQSSSTTQLIWSIVLVLSCAPMCLSSVYKEKALGETDIDIIYLNGKVASYQFLALVVFVIPIAYAMGLSPSELPSNMTDGLMCLFGHGPELPSMVAGITAAVSENTCTTAPLYVSTYLIFNIAYNVVLLVILKYGSANVLWLASTMMVPIGNVAFSLNFVPGHQDLRPSDISGLAFILIGLLIYRFSGMVIAYVQQILKGPVEAEARLKVRLIERGVTRSNAKYVGLNQAEFLEPVIETRVWKAQRANLARSPEQLRANLLLRLGIPPSPNHSKVFGHSSSMIRPSAQLPAINVIHRVPHGGGGGVTFQGTLQKSRPPKERKSNANPDTLESNLSEDIL